MNKENLAVNIGQFYGERLQSIKQFRDLSAVLAWGGFILSPVAAMMVGRQELFVGMLVSGLAGVINDLRLEGLGTSTEKNFEAAKRALSE